MLRLYSGTALLASPPFFYFSRPPDGTDMGQCTYDNQQAGFLGEVEQTAFPNIPVPSLPETYFPFLLEEPNAEAVNDQLIDGAIAPAIRAMAALTVRPAAPQFIASGKCCSTTTASARTLIRKSIHSS